MIQARKTFDDTLSKVNSFESTLAIIFTKGFEMGKTSIKRRTRKAKPAGESIVD